MKKRLIVVLIVLLVAGSFWLGNLVFFRPFNPQNFYTRSFIQFAMHKPELLTQLHILEQFGITFHQSKLDDESEAMTDQNAKDLERILVDLKSYDSTRFTYSQKLSHDTFDWTMHMLKEGADRWRYHNYPVNQLFGIQNNFPSFMDSAHQVNSMGDAEDYVSRLSKVETKFQQVLEGLKIRENKGIIPPRFVIVKVLEEMGKFTATKPEENILYQSLQKKLEKSKISTKDQAEILAAAQKQIVQTVYPAYQLFIDYFRGLEAKATHDDGVWKFPDGDAYYAYMLRVHTTTDLDPESIHQLGLSEVERIEGEMRSILAEQKYDTRIPVGTLMHQINQEARFTYPDTDAGRELILNDYRQLLKEVDQTIRPYFSVHPKAALDVERIPLFKEKTAPGAYYDSPAMDGSKGGTFYANLFDVKASPKFGMRTLAYHEGIPGHHWQIATAQENKDLPFVRRIMPFTAYQEGWALYAERLAWEAGLEHDPFDNLGRLRAEIFRSVRLVVDTGIHKKRWTREQAIAYMSLHTGMADSDVVAEIERYIVSPGQACAYKVGMLKILELRENAKKELGEKFEIKEFHDVILGDGALPLSLLERNVNAWIASKKSSRVG